MKPKKSDAEENKTKRKYAKRISMYPLSPGEALAAVMQIPSRTRKRRKKIKGKLTPKEYADRAHKLSEAFISYLLG